MTLVEGIDKCQDFGNGPVKLDRDLRVEVKAREDLDESGVLADRDIVLFGNADDFFGDCTRAPGRHYGGGMLLRIILYCGCKFGFLVHTTGNFLLSRGWRVLQQILFHFTSLPAGEGDKLSDRQISRKQAQRFAHCDPLVQADLVFPADIGVGYAPQG